MLRTSSHAVRSTTPRSDGSDRCPGRVYHLL